MNSSKHARKVLTTAVGLFLRTTPEGYKFVAGAPFGSDYFLAFGRWNEITPEQVLGQFNPHAFNFLSIMYGIARGGGADAVFRDMDMECITDEFERDRSDVEVYRIRPRFLRGREMWIMRLTNHTKELMFAEKGPTEEEQKMYGVDPEGYKYYWLKLSPDTIHLEGFRESLSDLVGWTFRRPPKALTKEEILEKYPMYVLNRELGIVMPPYEPDVEA